MALDTIPTMPSLRPPWSPLALVSEGRPYTQPFECPFPAGYLPASTFTVYSGIANTDIFATGADMIALAIGGGLPMATMAALTMGAPTTLLARMSRIGSFWTLGTFGQSYSNMTPSPRFGYSIGKSFKHQCYFRLNVFAVGWILIVLPQWLFSVVIPALEYRTNSRFKRSYVRHGRILATAVADNKVRVLIFERQGAPSSDFQSVSTTMTVYAPDGTHHDYSAKGTTDGGWFLELGDAGGGQPASQTSGTQGGQPSDVYVGTGWFFTLSKPIIVEDPNLLHEFGVKIKDGLPMSGQQQASVEVNVVGVWLPQPDNTSLQQLYASQSDVDQYRMRLPENDGDEARYAEARTLGGDKAAGIAKLTEKPGTIRVAIGGSDKSSIGHSGRQNFHDHNLDGEFLCTESSYFEIVSQPRSDTIEVANVCVNDPSKKFKDSLGSEFTVYQQNAWFISEMYVGSVHEFCSGTTTAESNAPSWTCKRGFETILPASDRTASVQSLEQRIVAPFQCQNKAFSKFGGWRLNAGDLKSYAVKSVTVTAAGTDSASGDTVYSVSVTLPEGVKAPAGPVSLTFDEPYRGWGGRLSGVGNYDLSINSAPALDEHNIWTILTGGYYGSGFWEPLARLPEDSRVTVTSWAFGANQGGGSDRPAVYVSTYGRATGVSCCTVNPTNRQYVFYTEPLSQVAAFRSAVPPWIEKREEMAVRCGEFSTTWSADSYVAARGWAKVAQGSYWLTVSDAGYQWPLYASEVSGRGGIETPATRKHEKTISVTDATPIVLPFEYYGPDSGDSAKTRVPMCVRTRSKPTLGLAATKADQIDVVAAGGVARATSAASIDPVEYSTAAQCVIGMQIHDAHSFDDDGLLLVYGGRVRDFTLGGNTTKRTGRDCVFMLASADSGESWWSPKFRGRRPADSSDMEEASLPMMVLYDFVYAGSVVDRSTRRCWVFGYSYAAEGAQAARDLQHAFLGVYVFDLNLLAKADSGAPLVKTYAVKRVAAGSDGAKPVCYYRIPTGVETPFGDGLLEVAESKECNEELVRVIGGEKSGADIKESVSPDVIGIGGERISIGGNASKMPIYMRLEKYGGVVALFSGSGVKNWGVCTYESSGGSKKPIVYARGGEAPTVVGQNLFYFLGDTLYFKRMNVSAGGSIANEQDLLDGQAPSIVTTDSFPHKIAAQFAGTGEATVYHLSKRGYVAASHSLDGGASWKPLHNW